MKQTISDRVREYSGDDPQLILEVMKLEQMAAGRVAHIATNGKFPNWSLDRWFSFLGTILTGMLAAVATTVSSTESLAQTAVNQVGIVSAATATSGACGAGDFTIHDYRGTTFWKRLTGTYGWQETTSSGGVFTRVVSGSWRITAAITSITITLASGNFVAGTKFSLYGMS